MVAVLRDGRSAGDDEKNIPTVPLPQPVTTSFTYRSLRRIDTAAFSLDILQSRLYGEPELDADCYADLFDAEVKRVLDIHAPLRTGRHRCSQHDSRHLSDEDKPSNNAGALDVGTVEQARRLTSRLICRLVQQHVSASRSHEPMRSSKSSMRCPVMCAPPGDRHRDCCTASRMLCTMTLSARS